MPTIRDGRGVLTEHRTELAANPPGPIERSRVSAARMADFAAERVERVAPKRVPAAPDGPNLGRRVGRPRVTQAQRDARTAAFLEAVRVSSSHAEAGQRLGLSGARVAQVIGELRRAGQLPLDVDNLLRARSGQRPIDPAGKTAAEIRREIASQGQEASAPATAAVDRGQPDASGSTEVATPPGLLFAGEDRCPFARKLDATLVVVCDREPHDGGHRGRLIRIGLQDAQVLGHAAVPA